MKCCNCLVVLLGGLLQLPGGLLLFGGSFGGLLLRFGDLLLGVLLLLLPGGVIAVDFLLPCYNMP